MVINLHLNLISKYNEDNDMNEQLIKLLILGIV